VLEFHLETDEADGPWILQHSTDGRGWEDLIFLEQVEGAAGFGIEFGRKALQGGAFRSGLFRATKRGEDGKVYREFLAARVTWRAADISSYTYVVRSSQGMVDWEARYTVTDGEVTMMETISIFPSFFTAPADRTIEDWFEIVANAVEQNAATIDVDWNVGTGYPERGFIDLDVLLADEERSWSISELTSLE